MQNQPVADFQIRVAELGQYPPFGAVCMLGWILYNPAATFTQDSPFVNLSVYGHKKIGF
jgi:hypothetical protein